MTNKFSGIPCGKEGQAVRWVSLEELQHIDMAPSARSIAACLNDMKEVLWRRLGVEPKSQSACS